MSEREHAPKRGDKFWDQNRHPEGQPNGRIVDVDWHEKEITVEFYDEKKSWKQYDFDEIEDLYYPDLFGGTYLIHKLVPRVHPDKQK